MSISQFATNHMNVKCAHVPSPQRRFLPIDLALAIELLNPRKNRLSIKPKRSDQHLPEYGQQQQRLRA